jgi:hypothetical protein
LNRWIGFRIDVLGASFTAGLAAYLVYGTRISAANTGLSLNMAVNFCFYIFWLIRIFNELEVESNRRDSIIILSLTSYLLRENTAWNVFKDISTSIMNLDQQNLAYHRHHGLQVEI